MSAEPGEQVRWDSLSAGRLLASRHPFRRIEQRQRRRGHDRVAAGRLCLRQGNRTVWMKAWNFAPRLAGLAPGTAADVLFQIEEDRYSAARGYPGWSLVLKDIRSRSAP